MEDNMIYYINKDKSDVEEPQKNKFNGPMLENINDGVLKINTDQLFTEYCSNDFNETPISKFENMYNDFKIVLKIVESLKTEYRSGEVLNNKPTKNSSSNQSSYTQAKTNSQSSLIDY
jgi:ubiquinone biosynthesis protein Coq4